MSASHRPALFGRLLVLVTCLCCLLAGCRPAEQGKATGGAARTTAPATTTSRDPNAPAPVSFTAPDPDQVEVPVGDQVDQSLNDIAAAGSTVVAVGREESASLSRPLFITSTDFGRHFIRATVNADTLGSQGNDESALKVAADPEAGFLALGRDSAGRHLTWTSSDGRAWRRSSDAAGAFQEDEEVAGLVRAKDRWIAAGTVQDPGSEKFQVVTWSSKDGDRWTRREASVNLAGPRETLTTSLFAVHGSDMIITGDLEDNSDDEQPNRITVLRSADAGRTWYSVDTPADLGGDYRAYLNHLIFADGQFIAAADGDGADTDKDSSWDGVVLSGGPHGDSWRTIAKPRAFGSDADDYGQVVVHTSTGWVLGGSVGKSPSDARLAVGKSLDQLRSVDNPSFVGEQSQSIYDGVTLGDTAFLLGRDARTGSNDPMLVRVHDGQSTRVDLPLSGATPSVDVASLIKTSVGYRAVGSVNGTPLTWASDDGIGWDDPAVLSARGRSGVTTGYPSDIAADTEGTTIAVGTLDRTRGSRIGAWMISADGKISQLTDDAFVSGVADDYGYLDADAITHSEKGWLIAGTETANGRTDAVFLHSDDGRTWKRGVGTTKRKLSETDRSAGRTPWSTFLDPGVGLSISDTIATDEGFWVFGTRGEDTGSAGTHHDPVVWFSSDGISWGAPDKLPLPKGVHDVDVSATAADTDGRLVLTGVSDAGTVDQSERRTLTWTYQPDAKTWRLAAAIPGEARLADIVKISGGWLAVGGDWSGANQNAILWTSRDARSWTAVPGVHRTAGPGRQTLQAAIPERGRILLLGYDVPPTGGGHFTEAIDPPKP